MSKIPSIAMIPSGYKANKVYSVLPTNGDGDLTFSRVSTATRVNELGLIEDVATGVPRLDYSGSVCPSLLVEPQSTNLIPYSEDFTNLAWSKLNSGVGIAPIVTSNQGIAPDGTLTADRVQFNLNVGITSGDSSVISDTVTVTSGATTTKSIYVKSNDGATYNCIIYDGATGDELEVIVTNEWKRFDVVNSVPLTNSSLTFGLRNAFGVTGQSDTADVLVWGAQLEEQAYATSYIPTSGATATRVAETVSKIGLENYINSNEGVFYVNCAALSNDSVVKTISLTDGSINNRISILFATSNVINVTIISSGVVVESISYSAPDITEFNNVAVFYSNGIVKLYVNGAQRNVTGTAFTGFSSNLSTIESDRGNNVQFFYGNIKDLRVYNQALTDIELQQLTS